MMTFKRPSGIVMGLAVLAAGTVAYAPAIGAEAAPGSASGGTVILCNDSYLRGFLVFRTPVQISKDGQISTALDPAAKEPRPLADFQSPLPPADWMKPEFDDSTWERRRTPVELAPAWQMGTASLHSVTVNSIICLRWKFVVDEPAKVQDLKLSLEYVGGLAVYVNGREITRVHLPEGDLKPDTLAEKYPDDLYCEPGNKFLSQPWPDQAIKKELMPNFERRYRKLADVAVPSNLLKKGTNVLALEIHRAPINATVLTTERFKEGAMSTQSGIWAYAGLKDLSLTAATGSALTPNVRRPKGVQVWNCAPFDTINAFDSGDGGDPLPVIVSAPKNGVFSGRLVVSSDQAIKGLNATVSDLAATDGGGKIPGSAVRVRCAAPGMAIPYSPWTPPHRFDGLFDAIPAEIPVIKTAPPHENYLRQPLSRPGITSGALAPLWLTVRVPRDAKPGTYMGTVSVSADGLKPTTVPLRVTVADWSIPDPKDLRILNFAYLSEDAVAKHYGVPLWSDKHLELVSRSMALMAEVNSRQVIVNMAINFYGGNKGGADCSNEESMVRWIKQPDGSYTYDFAIFDKYLDMVAKTIGKPSLLRVNCWGEAMLKDGKLLPGAMGSEHKILPVSLLDPATGKIEPMEQPCPGTEESYAFWKPVLDEVRKKVEARGWWDVTAMGHNSYATGPNPKVVSVYKRIWSDGVWSYTAHNGTLGMRFPAAEKGVSMPVRQADTVWQAGQPKARGQRALLQPRPNIWCFTWRSGMRDYSDLTLLRNVPEDEIMRGHDGVSDFGADLFPIKDSGGRYYCVGNGRGTGGPHCSTLAMLAPGPDGAVATERFEMLREGVEIAEAILFIEQALQDKKVGDDLESRANRLLDARAEAFLKNWTAGRFERDAKLMALAGEVAAKMGAK
ncbi:MAG: glycoside hydrolase domain-containing protein [Planctomycetota bacterium]